MKKIIVMVLVVASVLGTMVISANASDYVDIRSIGNSPKLPFTQTK